MESGFSLDVVVRKDAVVFQLVSTENQTLLIRGDAFPVSNLGLDILNRVGPFHVEGNGLAGGRLHKDFHPKSQNLALGMHYVGYAELAAAVSNAGGLGTITALTQKTPEDLRAEIKKCKTMTDKPIAVNVTILPMLNSPDYGAYVQVILDEKIPVVETAGRKPGDWVKRFKEAGVIVIHKCRRKF